MLDNDFDMDSFSLRLMVRNVVVGFCASYSYSASDVAAEVGTH